MSVMSEVLADATKEVIHRDGRRQGETKSDRDDPTDNLTQGGFQVTLTHTVHHKICYG